MSSRRRIFRSATSGRPTCLKITSWLFSVITRHTETIQFQRERNPAQQVRYEDQASVQHSDDGRLATAIVLRNLVGDLVESPVNCRLIKQQAVQIGLHR